LIKYNSFSPIHKLPYGTVIQQQPFLSSSKFNAFLKIFMVKHGYFFADVTR